MSEAQQEVKPTMNLITVDAEVVVVETGQYRLHTTLPTNSDMALIAVAAIAEQLLANGVVSIMALHMAIDHGAQKLEFKPDTREA